MQQVRCQQVHSAFLENLLEEERRSSSQAEQEREALHAENQRLRASLARAQEEADALRVELMQRDVKARTQAAPAELVDQAAEVDALRMQLLQADLAAKRVVRQQQHKPTAVHQAVRDLLLCVARLGDDHCEPENASAYAEWRKLVDEPQPDPSDARVWEGAQQVLTTLVPELLRLYHGTYRAYEGMRADRDRLIAHAQKLEGEMAGAEKLVRNMTRAQDEKFAKKLELLDKYDRLKEVVAENLQIKEYAKRMEQAMDALLQATRESAPQGYDAAMLQINRELMCRLGFRTALDDFKIDEVFVYRKLQATQQENEELRRNVQRLEQSVSNLKPAVLRLRDEKGRLEDEVVRLGKLVPPPRTLLWVRPITEDTPTEVATLRRRLGLAPETHCDMCVLCVGMAKEAERLLELERTAIRSEQRELQRLVDKEKEKYSVLTRNAEEEMKEAQRQMARKTSKVEARIAAALADKRVLEERVASLESEHAKTCASMRSAHDLKLAAKNKSIEELSLQAAQSVAAGPALDLLSRVLDPAWPGVEQFLAALDDCARLTDLHAEASTLESMYRRLVKAIGAVVMPATKSNLALLLPDATDMKMVETLCDFLRPQLPLLDRDVHYSVPEVKDLVRSLLSAWQHAYRLLHRMTPLLLPHAQQQQQPPQ